MIKSIYMTTANTSTSTLHAFKAAFFKALSHPLRLAILDALRDGEKSVGLLVAKLGVEQPVVSQQLSILRQRGFVEARKEGTVVFYSVIDPDVYAFLDLGRAIFERQLAQAGTVLAQLRKESGVQP
jgi:ArsR family transcriptional regulator